LTFAHFLLPLFLQANHRYTNGRDTILKKMYLSNIHLQLPFFNSVTQGGESGDHVMNNFIRVPGSEQIRHLHISAVSGIKKLLYLFSSGKVQKKNANIAKW